MEKQQTDKGALALKIFLIICIGQWVNLCDEPIKTILSAVYLYSVIKGGIFLLKKLYA